MKKQSLSEHMKLVIIPTIDKLFPGVCWADLVLWAMNIHGFREIHWNGRCKRAPYFSESWGGCYCMKNKTAEAAAMWKAAESFIECASCGDPCDPTIVAGICDPCVMVQLGSVGGD